MRSEQRSFEKASFLPVTVPHADTTFVRCYEERRYVGRLSIVNGKFVKKASIGASLSIHPFHYPFYRLWFIGVIEFWRQEIDLEVHLRIQEWCRLVVPCKWVQVSAISPVPHPEVFFFHVDGRDWNLRGASLAPRFESVGVGILQRSCLNSWYCCPFGYLYYSCRALCNGCIALSQWCVLWRRKRFRIE